MLQCYSLLLAMEESEFRAAHGRLKQSFEGNGEKIADDEKLNHMGKMVELLLPKGSTDTLIQCLRVRKGKRLICRLLPYMTLVSCRRSCRF